MVAAPEELGLSPMHVACLNGDEEKVIETLRRHPQALELTTQDGVTPLMLASLMGHFKVVKYLVVVASANILKANLNQKTAADFARDDEFSNLTRQEFFEAGIGQENKRAAKNKQEILGLLSSFARRTISKKLHRQGGDAGFHGIKLAPNGTKIEVYGLIDTIETRVPLPEIKTLGMLMPERDGLPISSAFDFAQDSEAAAVPGPVFYASSGWKTSHKRNPQVVDSELWTWVAHKLVAPHFGHVFPRGRDNGNMRPEPEHIGRVQASHVEVVLSTCYVFSLTEALVVRQPWQDEQTYIREQFQCLLDDRVRKRMKLGARRNMVIFIDSWPCQSCQDYVEIVGKLAGISFRIRGGHWIGSYPASRAAEMTPKGARWAPPDHRLADVEDELARARAAVATNPNLMDSFRYRLERDAAAVMSPEQPETDATPSLADDDVDDEEDLPDAATLFTPPPEKPEEVSIEKQLAFRDHINKFAFQAQVQRNISQVQRNIPRVQKRPRYAPYIVPNPLDFKPFPPTPVLYNPFIDSTSPEPSNETIGETMGVDEEEGDYSYSDLQFRIR